MMAVTSAAQSMPTMPAATPLVVAFVCTRKPPTAAMMAPGNSIQRNVLMKNIIEDDSTEKQSIWAELPSFVERGDGYIDGWKPSEPSGDASLNTLLGELYADIAVKYAREVRDPAFVGMVMAAIYFKTTRGLIRMGETEQGFLNRIARLAYVGSLN
jgi:hypothetical protein